MTTLQLHPRSGTQSSAAVDIDDLLEGLRILLVEDDPDSAELFTFVFEIAKAKVVTKPSAGEAFAILEDYQPDILVSNIVLPDIDGYSLVELVHTYEEERGRQIIAVAVTASARDINRAKAQSVGFHANIPKPINPLELVVELARLTGRYN